MFSSIQTRLFEPLRVVVNNWFSDGGPLMSAAMAYYGALSLYPLLLVLIAGLGWLSALVPNLDVRQQDLLEVVGQDISPWLAEQFGAILAGIKSNASIGGPIGLVTLAIAAIGIFVQIDDVFSHVWHQREEASKGVIGTVRTVLWSRLTAFLMLVGLGLFIVVVWMVNLMLGGVVTYLEQWAGEGNWLRSSQFAVSTVLNALLFTLVYKSLPNAPVPWRAAAIGGLFTASVWQIGLRLLEMFLISRSYGAYGIIGSFLAIMLWMYYASAVFIAGAELVHYHCTAHTPEGPASSMP
jgi:membrane protein